MQTEVDAEGIVHCGAALPFKNQHNVTQAYIQVVG